MTQGTLGAGKGVQEKRLLPKVLPLLFLVPPSRCALHWALGSGQSQLSGSAHTLSQLWKPRSAWRQMQSEVTRRRRWASSHLFFWGPLQRDLN